LYLKFKRQFNYSDSKKQSQHKAPVTKRYQAFFYSLFVFTHCRPPKGVLAFSFIKLYSLIMDVVIKYAKSAFKHGYTDADVRWAFKTKKYDAVFEEEGAVDKHLIIGFDRNANLIEILYNELDEDTVRVFHVMPCRNAFIALLYH